LPTQKAATEIRARAMSSAAGDMRGVLRFPVST
jgi:hypothetical protein